jgi:hypothetical protein
MPHHEHDDNLYTPNVPPGAIRLSHESIAHIEDALDGYAALDEIGKMTMRYVRRDEEIPFPPVEAVQWTGDNLDEVRAYPRVKTV